MGKNGVVWGVCPVKIGYNYSYGDTSRAYPASCRSSPVTLRGEKNKPYTDDEIVQMVKRDRESKDWFTTEHWRNKGVPEEQVEFTINGRQVTIYNWSSEKPFTDEHIERVTR